MSDLVTRLREPLTVDFSNPLEAAKVLRRMFVERAEAAAALEAASEPAPVGEDILQEISDLVEATLTRGDLQYGLGRIAGIVDRALAVRAKGEGWQLVPVEPTLPMLEAGHSFLPDLLEISAAKIYRAMLAAARSRKGEA